MTLDERKKVAEAWINSGKDKYEKKTYLTICNV